MANRQYSLVVMLSTGSCWMARQYLLPAPPTGDMTLSDSEELFNHQDVYSDVRLTGRGVSYSIKRDCYFAYGAFSMSPKVGDTKVEAELIKRGWTKVKE